MHIAVVLRLGPDLTEELEINADQTDIDREWIGIKLNDLDDQALEEAVLLKEAHGAKITAIGIAADGMDRQLQTAIARGADDALAVESDGDNPNSRTVAHLLAPVIRDRGVDLVLTGVQTSEDVFGQLAPYLAAILKWQTLNGVNRVAKVGEGLEVTQEYSGGYASTFAVKGPVVLGIQTASQPPRYVSGTKLRQATSFAVRKLGGELPNGFTPTAISSLRVPDRSHQAEMLGSDAKTVVARLLQVLGERGILGA
jgi:electron transfer flavoprotein beta subunit